MTRLAWHFLECSIPTNFLCLRFPSLDHIRVILGKGRLSIVRSLTSFGTLDLNGKSGSLGETMLCTI
jgi:hypothetical protein